MDEDLIKERLRDSKRWGVNSQPSLDQVESVLKRLPVSSVVVEWADILTIEFTRSLTGAEGYLLASLDQDEPEELTDPIMKVSLWWD